MNDIELINKTIISPIKQQFIWEKIIADWLKSEQHGLHDNQVNFFVSLNSWQLAAKAIEAWQLLQAWQISVADLQKYSWHLESKAFLCWSHQYQLICNKYYYQEQPLQQRQIADAVNSGTVDDIENCYKIICSDSRQEIIIAAKWVAHLTKHGNMVPQANKIGIVINDLEKNYLRIEYIFSNYLPNTEYEIRCFKGLDKQPAIQIAVLILKLANGYLTQGNIDYQDISKLLRTRFIKGGEAELISRSNLDYKLRKIIDGKASWQYMQQQVLNNTNKSILRELFSNFTSFLNKLSKKNNCSGWVDVVTKILQIFGWDDDIVAPEILTGWQEVLQQYVDLADLLLEHDLEYCIDILCKLTRAYNVTNKSLNNIVITDLYDGAKSKFDYLWVGNLTEENWPLEEQFNPLLPINLQKQQQQQVGNKIFTQLITNTSQQFIASVPRYVDNNLVRASKLISNFQSLSTNYLTKSNHGGKNLQVTPEIYQDNHAPNYQTNNFSGVNFLKLQISCPFKANAKIRLNANGINIPVNFLTKAEKGEIIHAVLAKFWEQHGSSVVAKQLDPELIRAQLLKITKQVLIQVKYHKPYSLSPAILKLESNRIAKLCGDFVENYDLVRKDFNIKYIEKKFTVQLQEFSINIKIDRIDELQDENSSLLIIDYKTGKIAISDLNYQNLDDPQLPIYSLALANVQGLILATIKNSDLAMSGLVQEQLNTTELLAGKFIGIPNWQQHLALYYDQLYDLMQQFKQGVAKVMPKYGSTTCKLCDLQSMCRIHNC
jgi:probable DNA repair protein